MTRGWVDDDRTIPLRLWPGLTWNLSTQGRFPLDIYLVWILYKSIHISLIPDTPSPVFLWAMCSAPEDSDLPVIQVHIWTTWQLQMVSPFIGIIEITGEQTWSMWKEKEVFWIMHDCCLASLMTNKAGTTMSPTTNRWQHHTKAKKSVM